jgi:hypothetical protein
MEPSQTINDALLIRPSCSLFIALPPRGNDGGRKTVASVRMLCEECAAKCSRPSAADLKAVKAVVMGNVASYWAIGRLYSALLTAEPYLPR